MELIQMLNFLREMVPPSCSSTTEMVRDNYEMSLAASGGDVMPSDSGDSSELPPSGGRAQEEVDVEMSAMLSRAAVSVGLQCPHCLSRRSQLHTWYLRLAPSRARPQCRVFRKCMRNLGEAARGYVDVPQVERAALRATKVTAWVLGRAMSTLVVHERHLWPNLAQMSNAEKVRF
ncbi:dehydrodolichyl diphosphate synthase, partial [Triplophysa rosa]